MEQHLTSPASLGGIVVPPGDKSISHRAAIFNAIAEGVARVENFAPGDDGTSTVEVLRQLGVPVQRDRDVLLVQGGALEEPTGVLDVGNSGTTMRLMAGVLAAQPFLSVLTGDASIRSRPMGRITEPLRQMGAEVLGRRGGAYAPLAIRGGGLRGLRYTLPVASAQLKSALLLAGTFAEGETVLEQPAASRDHTELMLRAMGVDVEEAGLRVTVRPGRLQAADIVVPADVSSAAFWLVAGVCHPDAEVRVQGVGVNPSRTGVLDALQAMGARVAMENRRIQGGEWVADLVARSSELEATEMTGSIIPRLIDELPILALAACFARGTTVIGDAQELRVKESDRITATLEGLQRLGAQVEETDDGMRVVGGRSLVGATVRSHGDHRIAMTMGVAGLLASGTTVVEGAEVASVSYPGFWSDWERLSAKASHA